MLALRLVPLESLLVFFAKLDSSLAQAAPLSSHRNLLQELESQRLAGFSVVESVGRRWEGGFWGHALLVGVEDFAFGLKDFDAYVGVLSQRGRVEAPAAVRTPG